MPEESESTGPFEEVGLRLGCKASDGYYARIGKNGKEIRRHFERAGLAAADPGAPGARAGIHFVQSHGFAGFEQAEATARASADIGL
jgi:hypothetical protein